MTTTLDKIATGCMESGLPDVDERHRKAGAAARRYAETGRSFHQGEEARALLDAVELDQWHREPTKPMTTAELLMVAAIIAARAEGEELSLGNQIASDDDEGDEIAFFAEIVDDEGNRHWSDLIFGTSNPETALDDAHSFSENEGELVAGRDLKVRGPFVIPGAAAASFLAAPEPDGGPDPLRQLAPTA